MDKKEEKFGYIRKISKKTWQMTISLGHLNGSRIRKYKNVKANNREEALEKLKEFALEYKDKCTKNKELNKKVKILRIEGLNYCKNNCDLKTCPFKDSKLKWNNCRVFKFILYKIKRLKEDYNIKV